MKTIKAKIRGVGLGILLHNPAGMGQSNGKKVIPTPEQEAAAGCYWTEDKASVAIQSWNLSRALVKAAAQYKNGKTSMSRVVAASVAVEPAMLSFGTKDYGIDTRRAVVQRQGILRSRPLLRTGSLSSTCSSTRKMSARRFSQHCGRSVRTRDGASASAISGSRRTVRSASSWWSRGKFSRFLAWLGTACHGSARLGEAWVVCTHTQTLFQHGLVRRGSAWPGAAWLGEDFKIQRGNYDNNQSG